MTSDFIYDAVGHDLVKFYRNNPVIAAHDLLGVDLYPLQQVVIEDSWFKKFSVLVACRGSGKCVAGDTIIYTSEGLEEIGSMSNELLVSEEIDLSVHGFKGHAQRNRAHKWYFDGEKEILKITTQHGYQLKAAYDEHRIKAVNDHGGIDWKYVRDLKLGDFLPIDRKFSFKPRLGKDRKFFEDIIEATVIGSFLSDKGLPEEIKSIDIPHLNLLIKKLSGPKEKKIPVKILNSIPLLRSCLRALFTSSAVLEKNRLIFYSDNEVLSRQVHTVLLAFGVISKLTVGPTNIIAISGFSLKKFISQVGLIGKSNQAANYDITGSFLEDLVPLNAKRLTYILSHLPKNSFYHQLIESLKNTKNESIKYSDLIDTINLCKESNYSDEHLEYFKFLYDRKFFFDKVVSIEQGYDKVYDLSCNDDNSYISNGFVSHNTFNVGVLASLSALLYPGIKIGFISASFRQAKFCFKEVENLWNASPIFQQATKGRPVHNPDSYRIEMKSAGNRTGGVIEAIPIGFEGAKVRGSRFQYIFVDEFAQVPEDVFNKVIRPMAATNLRPMDKYRISRKYKPMLEAGHITEEEYNNMVSGTGFVTNRIMVCSSAYYKFNHLYTRYEAYKQAIRDGSKDYAVHKISYRDIPEEILDQDGIIEARNTMSTTEFAMEYESLFVSDTDGVFKASLLESCSNRCDILLSCDLECVMAIDPARKKDDFAISIFKIGSPHETVYARRFVDKKIQESVKIIEILLSRYNVVHICLDAGAGGGGQVVADLLETIEPPIYRIDDEVHREGRRILELVNFNSRWIHEAVNNTKYLLENEMLVFPRSPSLFENSSEDAENAYQDIKAMLTQTTNIVATPLRSGAIHYDLPGGAKETDGSDGLKKDLFSTLILGGKALYEMKHRPQILLSPILDLGIVRERLW
jgi:hypothetical protein